MSSSIRLKNEEDTELIIRHPNTKNAVSINSNQIVISVSTIADMEAILLPNDGATCIVKGKDSGGIGGIFIYSLGSWNSAIVW